MKRLGT